MKERYQGKGYHRACDDVLDCMVSYPFLSRLRVRFSRFRNPMRLDGRHRWHRCGLLCRLTLPWQ